MARHKKSSRYQKKRGRGIRKKKSKKRRHHGSSHTSRPDYLAWSVRPTQGAGKILPEGFEYGRRQLYRELMGEAFSRDLKYLNPASGSDYLSPGGSATFEFTTGQNEWIKFLDQPIILYYSIKGNNPNIVQGGNAKQVALLWYVNSQDFKDCQISPAYGASCLIDRASLSLNGVRLTDGIALGSFSHIYKALNNRLSRSTDRIANNCQYLQMHETDRTPPKELLPAWAGPPAAEAGEQALNANQVPGAYSAMMEDPLETFAAAHKMVCHNAWNDNKNIVQNVSLDGYPFLSKPRNHCMANLNKTSETNNQYFIPPSTTICITLFFRSSPSMMLDWGNTQKDAVYYKSANPPNQLYKDVSVEIKKVVLAYESFVPKNSKMTREISHKRLSMHFDTPSINTYLMQANAQHIETNLHIQAGTRSIIIFWMYGFSLWPFEGSNRTQRGGDFVFPDQIKNFTMKHPDGGYLIAKDLGELSGSAAYRNVVLNNYFVYLRNMKIIDDPLSTFIIDDNTKKCYNNFLFADMRSYNVNKSVTIKATTSFDGGNGVCPDNLYLVMVQIGESALIKSGDEWSFHSVVAD